MMCCCVFDMQRLVQIVRTGSMLVTGPAFRYDQPTKLVRSDTINGNACLTHHIQSVAIVQD